MLAGLIALSCTLIDSTAFKCEHPNQEMTSEGEDEEGDPGHHIFSNTLYLENIGADLDTIGPPLY